YASADAFIYASETETMGNVVLEAMASGVAVVAPRAGGIPSLVDHEATGFLYAPRDLPEATHFARLVLDDEKVCTRIGQSARQAIDNLKWERSIGRVRQIYAEAIEQGRRPVSMCTWQQRLARATTLGLVSAFRSVPARKARRRPAAALVTTA